MGFRISWAGFHGIDKAEILGRLGLVDIGQTDEANEAPFSGAELPNEWFVLFANQYDFVTPQRLASWSSTCLAVACQVHETVMISRAFSFSHGNCLWQIEHDSQKEANHLHVQGSLPEAFEAIEKKQRSLQADGKKFAGFGVDYIFEIPVETAASTCGYRHDRWKYDWGVPQFTQLIAK